MARKKKIRRSADDPAAAKTAINQPVSFSPFKDLKKLVGQRPVSRPAAPAKPAPPSALVIAEPAVPVDDAALFREAFAGVRPLDATRAGRTPVEPRVEHKVVSEDAEVVARLSDLVSGHGTFDVTETEEYVEGARVGIDPRMVTRLRRGEFAMQEHVDLHGMIQPDAHAALTAFIVDSVRKGHRSVLVVHGRGLGSPGGRPVLKHATVEWLSHGTIGGHVLAFTTARPADGGAGAMYVLLRREKQRAPFDILQGAKRRG
ncbi:MAG TPA: Smr/MutS family protein [Candidatus Binataceae bacterium]|nr:Smr/MutS family protein [Candidatus Binataceae bacterium]